MAALQSIKLPLARTAPNPDVSPIIAGRMKWSSANDDKRDRSSASSNPSDASGATRKAGTSAAKAAPGSEQRLLSACGRAHSRRARGGEKGARLHGDQGPADHQQILVR